ncbi:hypothetical protein RA180_19745 [Aeromonas salmonicida]|uniref:hypothetical protein n=1 Tax=Aeromonas salmonicida TaxID=645 RepID=UPI0027965DBD|nr:hypothetical protein [Aeromonas salmonicida]MDQ1886231.1 hypothetical protein [Aeromonas salmonicida]
MLHHKLIAGEQPGTYRVTDLVTDDDQLTIAKGVAITDKTLGPSGPAMTAAGQRTRSIFHAIFG